MGHWSRRAAPTAGVTLQTLKFNLNNNTFFMIELRGGLETGGKLQSVHGNIRGGKKFTAHIYESTLKHIVHIVETGKHNSKTLYV